MWCGGPTYGFICVRARAYIYLYIKYIICIVIFTLTIVDHCSDLSGFVMQLLTEH